MIEDQILGQEVKRLSAMAMKEDSWWSVTCEACHDRKNLGRVRVNITRHISVLRYAVSKTQVDEARRNVKFP